MTGRTGIVGPSGRTGNKLPHGQRVGQISQYTPEQQQLYKQQFAHVGPDSYLSRLAGGDQSLFNEIEAPALQQFSGLQGNLASRFSGAGSFGARRSSGFQNAANQQGSDFALQLQAQRQQLQRQAITDLMGISNQLLGQRPYEQFTYEKQKKPSFWGKLIGGGLGAAGGALVGQPFAGAQIGMGIGGMFDNPGSGGGGMNFGGMSGLDKQYGDFVANYLPGSVI
jgi:hypothetical protein